MGRRSDSMQSPLASARNLVKKRWTHTGTPHAPTPGRHRHPSGEERARLAPSPSTAPHEDRAQRTYFCPATADPLIGRVPGPSRRSAASARRRHLRAPRLQRQHSPPTPRRAGGLCLDGGERGCASSSITVTPPNRKEEVELSLGADMSFMRDGFLRRTTERARANARLSRRRHPVLMRLEQRGWCAAGHD